MTVLRRQLLRRPSRSAEVSLEGLREFAADADPTIASAAREALRCVDQAGADPRLMLLVIEAAVEETVEGVPRNLQRDEGGRYA